MSRLTGTDARGLMEAYAAVYAPQEITEEQVWEEVEEWVNSLVEEGYDLSEYTWEEVFQVYVDGFEQLNEQGRSSAAGEKAEKWRAERRMQDNVQRAQAPTLPTGRQRGASFRHQAVAADKGRGGDAAYRAGGGDKAARSGLTRQQIQQRGMQAVRAAGATQQPPTTQTQQPPTTQTQQPPTTQTQQPPTTQTQQPPTTPAATSARPPAAAPARASSPANASTSEKIAGGLKTYDAQRKAGDMAGASKTGMAVNKLKYGDNFAKPKTPNPLMKDNKISDMIAASKARQQGANVTSDNIASVRQSVQQANRPEVLNRQAPPGSAAARQQAASRPAATATSTSTPAPTKPAPAATPAATTPKPTPAATGSKKPGSIVSSFDAFDVVIGHLLDEGYADTEEAALAIMTNMSEEWRENIIEAEVLAQKGGVPGTVQVQKKKEGGFLGFGGKTISKPVPGTFKPSSPSSTDAARYNTQVDRKYGGAGKGQEPTKSALRTQETAKQSGHSGYMNVSNPSSIPDTGLPGRPSPGRAADQNMARKFSPYR